MATDTPRIPEQGVATLPDEAWERARRRAEIISPLAQSETVGHEAADMAAQALGLSRRQVYVLIRRARQGSGLVTDLVPGQSGGGKGKGRLPEPVERVIHELLQKRFLTKQKRSLAAFHREVTQVCKAQKLRVPARNTVALRIASLDPRKVIRRREGQDAARDLQGVGGEPPAVTAPLEQVQIDHTVIDLIVVDDRDRQPIGRPYLTLAIDVFTRCVLGMVVTLEAPSANGLADERQALAALPRQRGRVQERGPAPGLRAAWHPAGLSPAGTAALWRHRGTDHRHGDADDSRRTAGNDLLQP
ncbi:DNA-binding domain-containing protein [Escherichia coli]|uniref:DNA-binding domain-containing protein n=1 Tax=Escherichia coli TaxID=562 RepID=UPI003F5116DB